MTSPFEQTVFTSDRDTVKHWHDQMSTLLAIKRGEDVDEIRANLANYVQPNTNEFKDRKMQVLVKNKFGDREVKVMPASEFFKDVERNNFHLSPSMVAYKNSEEEQSVNAIGTEYGLSQRSLYKSKMKKAIGEGDTWGTKTFNAIQNALKIFNNAQSGAMSSNGTPLVNKSGHTTLTSVCRVLTSTANICGERFLAGNRLYNSYQRTLENILSTIVYTDLDAMQRVIERLGMNYATPEQVMDMVKRCSSKYWNNARRLKDISDFVYKLKPIELTAVLCLMDLEGLRVTNRDILNEFFSDFCDVPAIPENAVAEDYAAPENSDKYILCMSKLMISKPTALEINHLNAWHNECEAKWFDFLTVFFKSSIPPSGVYDIREMIRDVVQTSDTDSSIYTVDLVVDEFAKTTSQSLRMNGVLTYFIRMVAVNQHAQLSSNMNVSKAHLDRLTMKNEYLFGSYVTTTMSKHYFATQLMVEGVLQQKIKMEIKGVHLRSSKIAHDIKEFAHGLMREMLDCISEKRTIEAADVLAKAADLERQIIQDIEEGQWSWLTRQTIKAGEVYTNPESSVYQYHLLWNEVFGPKYGMAPPPPYSAIKVNALTTTGKSIEEWLDSLDDPSFKDRLRNYLKANDKKDITTFYVPDDILPQIKALPKEVIKAADIRSIIKQNLKSVYAVFEAMGLFICNDKITRLISDEH